MLRPPCLIGLPYDASSSFLRGAAGAPARIREALHSPSANLWTERGVDLGAPDTLHDEGDLDLPESAQARVLIERGLAAVLNRGMRPVALGGDHSVAYPILRAIAGAHGPVTILHVDAHADLYDELDGDRFSHGCPFARIMEDGLCSRLVQVGIRTLTGHQIEQAARFGVEVVTMRDWEAGIRPDVDRGPVYVSVDLDGLDPAFAPGVSHWEPGGLSVRDVIGLIHALPAPIVGADVVELNPERDPQGITAMVAARLVREIAGQMILEDP